jgi:hypothetical protein
MVAAVLVSVPQRVCRPWSASSICTVISVKVVSMRSRHWAMTLSRGQSVVVRSFYPGGSRRAVPRAAWAAANAVPLKASATRSRGAGRPPAGRGSVALAGGDGDEGQGAHDPSAQVGPGGQAEAVEHLGVRGVTADPGGQVVVRPSRPCRGPGRGASPVAGRSEPAGGHLRAPGPPAQS